MGILQAIALGIIQGLTEFIPVSSSAHLVILRWLFGWNTEDTSAGMALDVALHLGTLFALLAYFWREWYDMIRAYLRTTRPARPLKLGAVQEGTQSVLMWPVVLACIPAGLAGVAFEDMVKGTFRQQPLMLAGALIGLGLLLMAADRIGKKSRPMGEVRFRDWMVIGLAQALAIVPGVSRSGITITAGLFMGLQRDAAARFSFLLGAPIIFGAAVYELPVLLRQSLSADQLAAVAMGVLVSAIVGYLCIGFLLEYLRRQSVWVFVAYRVLLGIGVIAASVLGYLQT